MSEVSLKVAAGEAAAKAAWKVVAANPFSETSQNDVSHYVSGARFLASLLPSRDEIALEIYDSDVDLGEAVVGWGSLTDDIRDYYRHNADAVLALIRERIEGQEVA